ncbi:PDZ domain-containing protein [Brevibacillus laterosporus]|uniref:endopeptidase La n=1 Tax=Brevibacillus laterosporus TaxID=1465 RepID=A0A518VDH7_BRELA|nr:PDZ domain-containing protein [Brevibacillus laterosporus]
MQNEHQSNERLRPTNKRNVAVLVAMAIMALMIISTYIPLPYYVQRAGTAKELAPIITVEGGVKDEKGTFMLTTVRMSRATPLWYVYAQFSKDVDLISDKFITAQGESDEDYAKRELLVMQRSQQVAEAVALKKAGYPVKMEDQGVLILSVMDGYPAKNVLKVGDVITSLNNKPVKTTNDLFLLLEGKKAGDAITLQFKRDGQEKKAELVLAQLPENNGAKSHRAGFGITPQDQKRILFDKKITIAANNIGGPSAGLMFTLEIYNQLRPEIDITRGYRIAGTGEMNSDGTVGRIGGINHKIIAADAAGAEIFFAPNDTSGDKSNYEVAVETAKRIHTSMRIVPVKTVDDALQYLQHLKPKGTE